MLINIISSHLQSEELRVFLSCRSEHHLFLYNNRYVILACSISVHNCLRMDSKLQSVNKLFCINCNILLNKYMRMEKNYLVLEQDTEVVSVICNWIWPVIITEEDYICERCFQLVLKTNLEQQGDNTNNDSSSEATRFGHLMICLQCGRSVKKRQSHLILSQTAQYHEKIIQMIQDKVLRVLLPSDRVCHSCVLTLKRRASPEERCVQKIIECEITPINEGQEPIKEVQNTPRAVRQRRTYSHFEDQELHSEVELSVPVQNTENTIQSPQNKKLSTDKLQPKVIIQPSTSEIILKNYKRAPNTASHCVFYGCQNVFSLRTVCNELRRSILTDYKYYLPIHARVCAEHMLQKNWAELCESENNMSTFTVEHIEDMLSYINSTMPYLDFSTMASVEKIENHVFLYWMGITKEDFLTLLQYLPRVHAVRRGILGLACILIKMRTGDSNQRIATLLQIRRQTIEKCMKDVKENLGDNDLISYTSTRLVS